MNQTLANSAGSACPRPHAENLGLRPALLLLVVAGSILLPGTIGVSFVDRDEGWYAQVCREMLQTGDWLVPRYLGEVWLAKPPLSYWLVTASFALLGMAEWQARLVPVAATSINVLLVAALAARLYGRRVGLWAGLVFITSGLTAVVGKMLLTDPAMLTCTLAAVLVHWDIANRGLSHRRAALYWLAIGLGILAKGPATLVFAGAFAWALIRVGHWRTWLSQWRWWAWLPLALVVAGPWYVCMARRAGETLVGQFIGYEILARIAREPHGHGGPPGYYFLISLAGLMPWTVLAPAALIDAFRQRRTEPACRLLLVWLVVPWIILELIHSKLPHYVMPCYVPLAIVLARYLDAVLRHAGFLPELPPERRRVFALWPRVMIGLGAAGIAAAVLFWNDLSGPAGAATAGVLVIGFTLAAILLRMRAGRPLRSALMTGVATAVMFHAVAGLWLLTSLEPLRLSRELARTVNSMAQPGDVIRFCGYDEPTVYFYLRQPARPIPPGELVEAIGTRPRSVVLALTQNARDRIPREHRSGLDLGRPRCELSGINYVKMNRETIHLFRLEPNTAPRFDHESQCRVPQ